MFVQKSHTHSLVILLKTFSNVEYNMCVLVGISEFQGITCKQANK